MSVYPSLCPSQVGVRVLSKRTHGSISFFGMGATFDLISNSFNIQTKDPKGHMAMSHCLTQKEPVRYTNKLIKKTTDTKLQRILAVNQKKSNAG